MGMASVSVSTVRSNQIIISCLTVRGMLVASMQGIDAEKNRIGYTQTIPAAKRALRLASCISIAGRNISVRPVALALASAVPLSMLQIQITG